MTIVFLLRTDTVTNKGEGEAYSVTKKGITHCNVWSSPKLQDHQVIIANGKKAITDIYNQYSAYNIISINNL